MQPDLPGVVQRVDDAIVVPGQLLRVQLDGGLDGLVERVGDGSGAAQGRAQRRHCHLAV